jgi:hypothetical protein
VGCFRLRNSKTVPYGKSAESLRSPEKRMGKEGVFIVMEIK